MLRTSIYLLLSVLFYLSSGGTVAATKCDDCNFPPSTLNNTAANAKIISLVPSFWKQKLPLSPLGKQFKNLIVNLTQSRNSLSSLLAIRSTILLGSFLPYLDQEPDCMLAAVINGTVAIALNSNPFPLIGSIINYPTKAFEFINDLQAAVILNSGCDFRCGQSPPDPLVNKTDCFENGMEYPIEDLWNLSDPAYSEISPDLKALVLNLYNSNDYLDNLLAVVTTFALTSTIQAIFSFWDLNWFTEILELQLAKPIKKECCFSLFKRIDKIINESSSITTNIIGYMLAYFNSLVTTP